MRRDVRGMSILEKDVLEAAKAYLNILEIQKKLTWKRINVGGMVRGGRLIKNMDMRGMADILIFLPGEKCIHAEAKRPGGKLERDQIAWRERLEKIGQRYIVFQSLQDLIKVLEEYGIKWKHGA